MGILDINLYRDDLTRVASQPIVRRTEMSPRTSTTKTWFSSTTSSIPAARSRAALRCAHAISDECVPFSWPSLWIAGTAKLPIEANYIGKRISTKDNEVVEVRLQEDRRRRRDLRDGKFVKRKDLLGIQDLDRQEILEILDTAESFRRFPHVPSRRFRRFVAKPSSICFLKRRLERVLLLRLPASDFPPTSSTCQRLPAASRKAKRLSTPPEPWTPWPQIAW